MRIIRGRKELRALAGKELGVSDWLVVTQERIDRFASASGDDYWIHTNPVRAKVESPFESTVAHGYLTLSLVTYLLRQIAYVENCGTTINYGLDRVRFVNPVRVGSSIRARQTIDSISTLKNGSLKVINDIVVEIDGENKLACVAKTLTVYLP